MSKTKLTFIADTHHFSLSLADDGRAYQMRSGSDQKCLKETGGIIDAAFSLISKSDADAVMIVGDLTNDGERVSHEEFRQKLYALSQKKAVYVITATHDWCCDENPRKYRGNAVYHDVPTLAHSELRDFYYDFGPKQANSEYITHLKTSSYTVDIGENVRLLALNDDQNGKGRAGFKEEHFQWIEKQIKKAASDKKILIGMEHHLIMPNIHPFITGGSTCVGDREYVASRLADAGLKYMFVGHSHMQGISRFTSPNGNTVTQVNVGSLCGYPSPIVNVAVTDSGLEISTDCLPSFTFGGKSCDTKEYLAAKVYALVDRVVEAAHLGKDEFSKRLTALELDGERIGKLYFALRPVFKWLSKARVSDVYRLLRRLGLGNCIAYQDAQTLWDKPIMEMVHEILLSVFDGTAVCSQKESAYYNVVMGAADALIKLRACPLTLNIKGTLENLLTESEYDINHCII